MVSSNAFVPMEDSAANPTCLSWPLQPSAEPPDELRVPPGVGSPPSSTHIRLTTR